ncbi:MAG: nicotinate phosphoribosyltransferase [Deltaproteobacteria bacterium]|nr:nicotinate phosphoribosyltransferase [Deltaproteobacteria bacterium]
MNGYPQSLLLNTEDLGFATDFYQLTMAAAYHAMESMPRGTFELFVRHLPPHRNFLIFAGLEQALASLQELRFSPEQVSYLRGLPQFEQIGDDFFEVLASFRFQGDIWAMAEGTAFFPYEPVMRVEGSLLEAQLVETLLLSTINFQSAIASKAARIRLSAGSEVHLAEFGSRRAHGPQAGTWVARAAFLAGFDSTSNVLAGQRLGIPIVGTMGHSYILAFDSEVEAFGHYQQQFPRHSVHLVDTFDSLEGVRQALETGRPFEAIRLDSGDLKTLAQGSRELLDAHGRQDVKIFGSGDLDEWKVRRLLGLGAPIDSFGVGTRLAALSDAPFLGGVYKLVELNREGQRSPRAKFSASKSTFPWPKQVYRRFREGFMAGDALLRADEAPEGDEQAVPLLHRVMERGKLVDIPDGDESGGLSLHSLEKAKQNCRLQLEQLPSPLKLLGASAFPYRVEIAASLRNNR